MRFIDRLPFNLNIGKAILSAQSSIGVTWLAKLIGNSHEELIYAPEVSLHREPSGFRLQINGLAATVELE
jgi:hypothetical protein